MENLDFGWEFGLMILAIVALIYFLIVFINYGLILLIGNGTERLLKKTIWKDKLKFSILNILSIYLPLALFIQIGINQILFDLVMNDNGQIELINSFGGSFFIELVFFYFGGWIGSLEVVGMIVLRQKYNQNWQIIKKENWGKRIRKIWFFISIILGLRFFFREFMNYYYIGNLFIYCFLCFAQTLIGISTIYGILKLWNVSTEPNEVGS